MYMFDQAACKQRTRFHAKTPKSVPEFAGTPEKINYTSQTPKIMCTDMHTFACIQPYTQSDMYTQFQHQP